MKRGLRKMKITERWHLWSLKREVKFLERKSKFLKNLIKHFKKKYGN